ncbi:MAG: DUF3109 family protein [Bacteroidales bacterium]|jgi:hypothetical protein|nr:DUF3109 family protein [Bacteroidales bacterium]
MKIIENCLVSDDLAEVHFVCDLEKCKGACCVEGDAGAPMLEDEIGMLEDVIDTVVKYMTPQGLQVLQEYGVFDYDAGGNFVTPLVNGGACIFTNYTDGIAWCAIEKAFDAGESDFRKPESCYLYPLRIKELSTGDTVNYHKWGICKAALKKGKALNVALYQFLKEPLIERYSEEWYAELVKEIENEKKA